MSGEEVNAQQEDKFTNIQKPIPGGNVNFALGLPLFPPEITAFGGLN